jgi:hypothetical protein
VSSTSSNATTNIVAQAIAGMPSPVQHEAQQVTLLAAAGHGSVEIARRLETTWPRIEEVRSSVGSAVVGVLRSEGYSAGEISRTLGIPTPVDHDPAQAQPRPDDAPEAGVDVLGLRP